MAALQHYIGNFFSFFSGIGREKLCITRLRSGGLGEWLDSRTWTIYPTLNCTEGHNTPEVINTIHDVATKVKTLQRVLSYYASIHGLIRTSAMLVEWQTGAGESGRD